MEQKKAVIISIFLIIIIAGLIFSLIFLIARFVGSRVGNTTTKTNTTQNSPAPSATSTISSPQPSGARLPSTGQNQGTQSNKDVYAGEGYQLNYPNTWSVLTCNNSKHFELDPSTTLDKLNTSCDRAIKPITVLVDTNPTCRGEVIKLGNISVVKTVEKIGDNIDYRWCTQTTPTLDITHRVSGETKPASSKVDFSKDIEEMISSFAVGRGS